LADIVKNGTNQVLYCPIINTSYNVVTSNVTATSIWIDINGTKTDITSSVSALTYDSNLGGQKLVIPSSLITATGRYTLCIKSAGNQPYILDGLIFNGVALDGVNGTTLNTNIANIPTAVTTTLLGTTVEGSYSYAEMLRILLAVIAGDTSVDGLTVTHTGLDGATARLVALATSSGRHVSSRVGD
jgi:hypothetical protein